MRILVAVAVTAALALRAEAQDVEHFDTIEKAVDAAKKAKKDVLVDFTGSDWCGWCIKLSDEVFKQDAWKKGASAKYVFVELDFPQRRKLDDRQKAYNERMQALYGIQGFPTILVLDSNGQAYAKTGYQEGGPEAYLKHLDELAARKQEIADLRAKAKEGKKEDQVAALESLLGKLAEWEVEAGWLDVKESLVALDPPKETKVKHARALALAFHGRGDVDKHKKYLQIVRDLDKDAAAGIETSIKLETDVMPLLKKQDWKGGLEKLKPMLEAKGEAGQQAHYFAGVCEFRLGNKEGALKYIEKALELAPDGPLADECKAAIEHLKP